MPKAMVLVVQDTPTWLSAIQSEFRQIGCFFFQHFTTSVHDVQKSSAEKKT
jgi:uncharacterized protein with von Willebrand factor type A (vWA) domain